MVVVVSPVAVVMVVSAAAVGFFITSSSSFSSSSSPKPGQRGQLRKPCSAAPQVRHERPPRGLCKRKGRGEPGRSERRRERLDKRLDVVKAPLRGAVQTGGV